ncbi:beta-lactamase family protein [Aquimarina sp. TRL1]|uniref:serine hydrolase domain-containing protein n=1 Tax=Aquimarina sp. (strain TRL1) TaxID=2736252 RepID=UPI001589FB39|nr:serine hydrolase domain-containing protein [Aquimarina sp. TRL1]QKX06155.1 beta-lactamase family protein [Aquimarina sp. TRL1]
MKIKFEILYLILLVLNSCASQSKTDTLTLIVDKEADTFLKDTRFNAVSIAVYYKGESYIGHYGELDKNQRNKPTDETLYEIASVTKTMTGYLVACAIEEGKIELNTPIYEILGKDYRNLIYKDEPIRMIHLITHTSGIPLNIGEVSALYQTPNFDNYSKAKEILSTYKKQKLLADLKSLELTEPPGKVYSYSNVAPNLVAHMLEVIYNKPFEELLKTKLFVPAKMKNSFINLDKDKQGFLANGYNEKHQLMPNFKEPINLWGAAGRVKSNSLDMLHYIKWQLNASNSIVKRSHKKLFKDVDNIWLAYFWDVIDDSNGTHIEHHGGIYGSQNWLMIYPEHEYGISIITNSSFPEANQIIKQTANQIIEQLK